MSEAKGPYEHDHRPKSVLTRRGCHACLWEDGFKAGRASRDGLRKALEMIAGDDKRGNRTVSASMAVAMKALEADGEVVE